MFNGDVTSVLLQILLCPFYRLLFLTRKLIFRNMILDRLAKDADIVARVEAGDDDTVAGFIDERRGKALIASAASGLERIETDGVNGLDAFFQSALDADQIFFQI